MIPKICQRTSLDDLAGAAGEPVRFVVVVVGNGCALVSAQTGRELMYVKLQGSGRHGGTRSAPEAWRYIRSLANPILFEEHSFYSPTGSCFGASALIHHVPRVDRVVASNFVVAPVGDVAERGRRKEARITYA